MKRVVALVAVLLLMTPLLSFAKSPRLKGYTHDKGTQVTVSDPIGWPISVLSKTHNKVAIESLTGMAVVQLRAYDPWWRVWGSEPATTTITIGGLPADTDLHIYTRGYREHVVEHSSKSGTLELAFNSSDEIQYIIKLKPSTIHIRQGGFLITKGGDCNMVGTWDEASLTCNLTGDVTQDIVIEDNDITLDGKNFKILGAGSGDGVYIDQSNVTVRNLSISGFSRGLVYRASFALLTGQTNGGRVEKVTFANTDYNIRIDGESDVTISGVRSTGANTGFAITDIKLDGFPTYGITVTDSTIQVSLTGMYVEGVDPLTVTQTNWTSNTTDLSQVSSGIILAQLPERGNYWDKFTACTQDTANPNHCTNKFSFNGLTDQLPYACKNGWKTGVICQILPPQPATCTDNLLDGDEVGVDCGGSCSTQCGKCVPLINNGDSKNKIDIVYVGSGFPDEESLSKAVVRATDIGDKNNGIFSVTPFKGTKTDFNVWMVADQQKFSSMQDAETKSRSLSRTTCPTNQMILLSVEPRFRSHAYVEKGIGQSDAFVTVGCEFLGTCSYPLDINGLEFGDSDTHVIRTVVHEFGHSFGGLADEYLYVDNDGNTFPSSGNTVDVPNCDASSSSPKWKSITSGAFEGCSYENWYRPYGNSLMKEQYTEPFTTFMAVNEAHLSTVINSYLSNTVNLSGAVQGKSYAVDITYSNGSWTMGPLVLIPIELSNVRKLIGVEHVDIFDSSTQLLASIPFVTPKTRVYSAPMNVFETDGTQKVGMPTGPVTEEVTNTKFTINLPVFSNATKYNIYDSENVLKYSTDNSTSSVATSTTTVRISVICHVPAGNPWNAHTISVGASAAKAHFAHGDYLGECKAISAINNSGNTTSLDETKGNGDKVPPGKAKKK